MCDEAECVDCFVAFSSVEELQRHHMERHSGEWVGGWVSGLWTCVSECVAVAVAVGVCGAWCVTAHLLVCLPCVCCCG
jgi:hypothetical protein